MFYSGRGSSALRCGLWLLGGHAVVTERSLFLIQLLVKRRSLPPCPLICKEQPLKMPKPSDCLTSAQPRSLVNAHH